MAESLKSYATQDQIAELNSKISTLNSKFTSETRTATTNAGGVAFFGNATQQMLSCRINANSNVNGMCIPYRSVTYGNGAKVLDSDMQPIISTELIFDIVWYS